MYDITDITSLTIHWSALIGLNFCLLHYLHYLYISWIKIGKSIISLCECVWRCVCVKRAQQGILIFSGHMGTYCTESYLDTHTHTHTEGSIG